MKKRFKWLLMNSSETFWFIRKNHVLRGRMTVFMRKSGKFSFLFEVLTWRKLDVFVFLRNVQ